MSCRYALILSVSLALTAEAISPVQKVLQLIDEMAVKVKNDLDTSAQTFQDAMKFCDSEVTEKGYAMKNSAANIEKLSAISEDQSSKIMSLETRIGEVSTSISSQEGELHAARSLRAKEHADFMVVEKQLADTVAELAGAQASITKTSSFAQLPKDTKDEVDAVLDGLSTLVDASFVTHAQQSKVQAFLQARAEGEDDGQGSSILSTLSEMSSKAERSLADTRKNEMNNAHNAAMLQQGMENALKSSNEELRGATQGKQMATEALAMATKDLANEKATTTEDAHYSQDLHHECMMKAEDWEIDTRDTVAELASLTKATQILTAKFAGLIETQVTRSMSAPDDDTRSRALRLIEQVGRKVHSTALVSLAYRASADPFNKVRNMVEDMIAKLLHEAAEEATQKAFCDEESAKSQKSKSQKEARLDKTNARIAKASSAQASLTSDVSNLSGEVAEIDAAVSAATAQRTAEKAAFMKAEKDFSESQDACASALEVLREYYEGASLVQVNSHTASKVLRDASSILDVLEFAESDFAKMLADARMTEANSQGDFDRMAKDSSDVKQIKETDIKGKRSEIMSLKSALSNYNEDKDGTTTELNAVVEYMSKLKPQCETQVSTYAERKAQREQELEGLKEALSLLEG